MNSLPLFFIHFSAENIINRFYCLTDNRQLTNCQLIYDFPLEPSNPRLPSFLTLGFCNLDFPPEPSNTILPSFLTLGFCNLDFSLDPYHYLLIST